MEIHIRTPDDFHLHLRDGDMLRSVLPHSMRVFGRATVMPNIQPAVRSARAAVAYRGRIHKARPDLPGVFTPLMAIELTENTTPIIIQKAISQGFKLFKIYPRNTTHNSEGGVANYGRVYEQLRLIARLGGIVLIHGEAHGPSTDERLREQEFLQTFERLVKYIKGIHVVFEHISTAAAVDVVKRLAKSYHVAATVTVHHLLFSREQAEHDPHLKCMPIIKEERDRLAIVKEVLEGNPRFFFGSDSAPHAVDQKEGSKPPPGVFSAPVALPLLAHFFDSHHQLERLEPFVSEYGARFYRLRLNAGKVVLRRESWKVPTRYGNIVPLWAGKQLEWRTQRYAIPH